MRAVPSTVGIGLQAPWSALRRAPWQFKALAAVCAFLAAMGLRLTFNALLGDGWPVAFALPVVALVSLLLGWRWGLLLAALVLAWLLLPWLPPTVQPWTPGSLAANAALLITCAAFGFVGPATPYAEGDGSTISLRGRARLALTLLLLAAIVPVLMFGALAWTSHRAALDRSLRQAEAAALMASEHVSRIVQANTIISRQMQSRLAAISADGALPASSELHRELASLARGLAHVNSLWILAADGFPVASSLVDPPPRINYSDREYFKFHQQGTGDPYVSRLLRTRSTNELFYDVSVPWLGPAQQFLGVINVTLHPGYVTEFFRRLAESSPELQVSLLRDDGFLLARWPQEADAGDRVADDHAIAHALRTTAGEPASRVTSGRLMRGQDVFLRRFEGWPLTVAVTVDRRVVAQQFSAGIAPTGAWILLGSVLLLGALGLALYWAQREVTTLERLAAESEARRQAEEGWRHAQRVEALGLLTSGVAHDFNNVLGVLANNLALLKSQKNGDATSSAVMRMERAVASGTQLSRRLLTFARRQPITPELTMPAEILPEVAELVQFAVGTDVRVTTRAADDVPAIRVDRSELDLAMLNLAVNSRDAGAQQLTISVSRMSARELPDGTGLRAEELAVFAVSDDGRGMDTRVSERAFDPFFTTKPPGKGSGLGLSQVFGLCAQAGGKAWISSNENGGTRVSLAFPALEPPTGAAESSA